MRMREIFVCYGSIKMDKIILEYSWNISSYKKKQENQVTKKSSQPPTGHSLIYYFWRLQLLVQQYINYEIEIFTATEKWFSRENAFNSPEWFQVLMKFENNLFFKPTEIQISALILHLRGAHVLAIGEKMFFFYIVPLLRCRSNRNIVSQCGHCRFTGYSLTKIRRWLKTDLRREGETQPCIFRVLGKIYLLLSEQKTM